MDLYLWCNRVSLLWLFIRTCLLCWDSLVYSRWTVQNKLRVIKGFCVRLNPCVVLIVRPPFSSIYCHVYHPSPPVGQSEERSDGSSLGSGAGSGPGESSALPLSDITSPGIRHAGCFFFFDYFVFFQCWSFWWVFCWPYVSCPHSSGFWLMLLIGHLVRNKRRFLLCINFINLNLSRQPWRSLWWDKSGASS